MTPNDEVTANVALAALLRKDAPLHPTIQELRRTFLPRLGTLDKIRAQLLIRRKK